MKFNWKIFTWAMAGLVALIIVVNRVEDYLINISYPIRDWRMDLDDVVSNVIAGAAVLVAYLAVRRRQKKIEDQVNGGMSELAKEVMLDHVETEGLNQSFLELLGRVEECMKENEDMRIFILKRFGEEM